MSYYNPDQYTEPQQGLEPKSSPRKQERLTFHNLLEYGRLLKGWGYDRNVRKMLMRNLIYGARYFSCD